MKSWITAKIADVADLSAGAAVVLIHVARLGVKTGPRTRS